MLIGEMIGTYGLGEVDAGVVAAAEMAALAITSMICARMLTLVPFRRIIFGGILCLAVGNMASIYANSHLALISVRVFCGIGAGSLLMVASAAIAGFEDSDRAYGQINTTSILAGMAGFALAPIVSSHFGTPITFPVILTIVIVLLPFAFLMPKNLAISSKSATAATSGNGDMPIDITLISIGVVLSCSVLASVWAFYVVLGERAGFGPDQINVILTYAILFTLLGSIFASTIGHKFGRLAPSVGGLVIMTGAIVGLSLSHDPVVYRILTGLNLFGLYLFIPYFLGYASAADPSGRGPAIVAGAFMLAAALGPYLGGIAIGLIGIESLALIAIVANSISLALFCVIDKRQKVPRTGTG